MTKYMDFSEGDCVVIITRGHAHDETILKECLSKTSLPGYIGMGEGMIIGNNVVGQVAIEDLSTIGCSVILPSIRFPSST
jgi:hypothetical protein